MKNANPVLEYVSSLFVHKNVSDTFKIDFFFQNVTVPSDT